MSDLIIINSFNMEEITSKKWSRKDIESFIKAHQDSY